MSVFGTIVKTVSPFRRSNRVSVFGSDNSWVEYSKFDHDLADKTGDDLLRELMTYFGIAIYAIGYSVYHESGPFSEKAHKTFFEAKKIYRICIHKLRTQSVYIPSTITSIVDSVELGMPLNLDEKRALCERLLFLYDGYVFSKYADVHKFSEFIRESASY